MQDESQSENAVADELNTLPIGKYPGDFTLLKTDTGLTIERALPQESFAGFIASVLVLLLGGLGFIALGVVLRSDPHHSSTSGRAGLILFGLFMLGAAASRKRMQSMIIRLQGSSLTVRKGKAGERTWHISAEERFFAVTHRKWFSHKPDRFDLRLSKGRRPGRCVVDSLDEKGCAWLVSTLNDQLSGKSRLDLDLEAGPIGSRSNNSGIPDFEQDASALSRGMLVLFFVAAHLFLLPLAVLLDIELIRGTKDADYGAGGFAVAFNLIAIGLVAGFAFAIRASILCLQERRNRMIIVKAFGLCVSLIAGGDVGVIMCFRYHLGVWVMFCSVTLLLTAAIVGFIAAQPFFLVQLIRGHGNRK